MRWHLPWGLQLYCVFYKQKPRNWEEEKQNRIDRRNNFSQEIGHGGFGYVYKGVLASGEEIAVKKLSEISKQGLDEFRTEVRSISGLRHINIARLYGWSVYKEEKLLIYEYLVNGSLERHLFGGGELNWQTRFHIIKGVAQGLAYIEEGRYNLILHRDLKPDNILLDRDMTPKISDFGLARMWTDQKSPWSWLNSKKKQLRFKSQNALAFTQLMKAKVGFLPLQTCRENLPHYFLYSCRLHGFRHR
ncbi:hypothetical protein Bca52824_047769 [Brassica carinata]|uniref:non-specific serine/threonine protein kinase n=1 Tax=Brassica carinata TaxID=52824 RepID=A0A8X7UQ96_BRACI|nr:hypothetical protein Bca52824_047769 [Brassica carinata]